MDGDDVRGREQLLEREPLDAVGPVLTLRVVRGDVHAERSAVAGDPATDAPEAHDAEATPVQHHARESLPFPATGLDVGRCGRQAPRAGEDERPGVLGRRGERGEQVAVLTQRPHADAGVLGCGSVDVRRAGAGEGDDAQRRGLCDRSGGERDARRRVDEPVERAHRLGERGRVEGDLDDLGAAGEGLADHVEREVGPEVADGEGRHVSTSDAWRCRVGSSRACRRCADRRPPRRRARRVRDAADRGACGSQRGSPARRGRRR